MRSVRVRAFVTILGLGLGVAAGLSVGTGSTRAEISGCTAITTVPYTITVQGIYCFTGDLATSITSGAAISIDTNNVVLDLNAHKLGGLSAGTATTAIGIYALDRQNITIRNGTVRGYAFGIKLDTLGPGSGTSLGHLVEFIRADQNTVSGIQVSAKGSIVRSNQVVSTGGSTAPGSPNKSAYGLFLTGEGNRVIENDVSTVTKAGTGVAWAILLSGDGPDFFAVGNRLTEADIGIEYNGSTTGKYRDNLTSNVTTDFIGGTPAGGNN